ncbi:hypothetical protein EEAAV_26785 (plasmid) [Rahnella aceris]
MLRNKIKLHDDKQLDIFSMFSDEEYLNVELKSSVINKAFEDKSLKVENISYGYMPPAGYLLHKVGTTNIGSVDLSIFEEYCAEGDGFLYRWTDDDIDTLMRKLLDESLERVQLIIKSNLIYKVNPDGIKVPNAFMLEELQWYMTEQFEMVCISLGYDPVEVRTGVKQILTEAVHPRILKKGQYINAKKDREVIFHSCRDGMEWDEFLDENYQPEMKSISMKWTDKGIIELYKILFKDSLAQFDHYISKGLCYVISPKGKIYVNPEVQRELDWFETGSFKWIAEYLGYDVNQFNKDIKNLLAFLKP